MKKQHILDSENELARAMHEAAADPLFMQDLEECMKDFATIDAAVLAYVESEPKV